MKIESAIQDRTNLARNFSNKCVELVNQNKLAEALEFCRNQGIEPPQCSLTAKSINADNQRAKARRMLCEVDWWTRRLKRQAIMDYENAQRSQGQITQFISDELLEYDRKNRRRR